MTDIYRIFEKSTRAITSDKKSYGGQVFDANTTTIHFQVLDRGQDWDFIADGYRPFIVFNVYDQYGNPYVYGTDSSPIFSGYEFTIPYEITSQLKSARAEYQLWFVKAEVADGFNGTNQGLLVTDYLLSAVDGIAFKPSCLRPSKPCGAEMPYAPTTAPSTIGALEFMRENSIILPMDLVGHVENGKSSGLDLIVHTLGGQMQQIHFPVATSTMDGSISVSSLPVGNGVNQIPLIIAPIGKGEALVYDVSSEGGFLVSGFRGAKIPTALKYVPIVGEGDTATRNILQLIGADGGVISTVDLPLENFLKGAEYDPARKVIIFHFENEALDFSFPINDLVDIYKGTPGHIFISSGSSSEGSATMYTIDLDPTFVESINSRFGEVSQAHAAHLVDYNNPHKVTKSQVGLGNVDNTSDADKPVSSAQRSYTDAVRTFATRVETDSIARDQVNTTQIQELRNSTDALSGLVSENAQTVNNELRNRYTKAETDTLLSSKMDLLGAGDNINFNGGKINVDLEGITIKADPVLNASSENAIQNKTVTAALDLKQDKLTPGVNIDITGNTISATLPRISVDNVLSYTSENPVQNKIIAMELDRKANIGEGVSVWKGQTSGGAYLYQTGDVVVYDGNLYISKVDNNDHHPDDTSCWNIVRGGTLASVIGVTAPTYIGVFGNDVSTDYVITHGLGSRNLIYSIITNDSEYGFVQAQVSAPTLNTVRVRLTSPPGTNGLVINILKVRTATPSSMEYPAVIDIMEPSMEWSVLNDTACPLYVQVYDPDGNDIIGDVVQSSVAGYSPVTVGFNDGPHSGTLFLASTDEDHVFEMNGTSMTLSSGSAWYLVQCFKDEEGLSILDVSQSGGQVVLTSSVRWVGTVGLYLATKTVTFTEGDLADVNGDASLFKLSRTHNLGRIVGAQVFTTAGELAGVDVSCPDGNTVEVFFTSRVSGTLLIL